MMHHHEPFIADALEHIGSQYLGFHGAVVAALGEIFLDHHHGQIASHDDVDVADFEIHFEDAIKNAFPALHHGAPSRQLAPAGMDANDLAILEPDLLHVLDI